MARFSGKIGFIKTVEVQKGIYEEQAIEKQYYGQVTRSYNRWESPSQVNETLTKSNTYSIGADSFAINNEEYMRYLVVNGQKWKITGIDDSSRPRIILTIGGIYNG